MNKIRLDQFLTQQYPQYSRTQIKRLIEEGFVIVDGDKKRKPSLIIHGGEKIEMVRRAPEVPKAVAEDIALDILFEDDFFMVINKPAGMVVHPAPGNFSGTLVNAVLHHLGEKIPLLCKEGLGEVDHGHDLSHQTSLYKGEEGLRPGIVHRLDKGTSGVMVVAKDEATLRQLSKQFKDRTVEKIYKALAHGKFARKQGTISFAMGRDTQHRRKFSSITRRSREATTHYKIIESYPVLTLLELKPETGRTHQIRVHLSEEGHPIVGDVLYGAKSFLSSVRNDGLREILSAVERPLLHAASLTISHPQTKQRMTFTAPFPPDFEFILATLKAIS